MAEAQNVPRKAITYSWTPDIKFKESLYRMKLCPSEEQGSTHTLESLLHNVVLTGALRTKSCASKSYVSVACGTPNGPEVSETGRVIRDLWQTRELQMTESSDLEIVAACV
jgi:hypothetical protein